MSLTDSESLIQQIIDDRVQRLVRSSAWAASVPAVVYRSDPGFPVTTEEERRRERESARGNRKAFIRHVLDSRLRTAIREIVSKYPSVTRQEIMKFVQEIFPASRGPEAADLFDAALITQAHDALIREQSWDCRAACQALADRLRVDPRTVQDYRLASRRKK